MSVVNAIQNKILELSGGEFEKLFDAYAYKKYGFRNIQTLGVQAGTNKPTKGTPDSYVITEEEKYILITCGSVRDRAASKIKEDILACLDNSKVKIPRERIHKIICGHISTNLSINQFDNLETMIGDIEVELVGIDTISHDIAYKYPTLAKEFLNISIDTHQLFDVDDFVKICDRSKINAPIGCDFWFREDELNEVTNAVTNCKITVVLGSSGIGKTRLVLEACRQYQNQGWTTFCVKSNGQLLYDDIPRYLDHQGKYLLFLDDANQVSSLSGLLNYIYTLPDEYEIKIIMTVRDYAKKRVLDAVLEHEKPNFITLKEFKDDEIKGILEKNLGIVNQEYLNRIADISQGNIRLAMLAGMRSLDGGLYTLRNVEEVYENYYGSAIEAADLKQDEILYLCIVSITGPVKQGSNPLYQMLLDKHIAAGKGDELIRKLYEQELIDWFKDEVVNISDQTMGDYILYYVLYKTKWISLFEIIKEFFPKHRNRIIYVINTLLSRFFSTDLESFIEQQIKKAWNESEENDEYYLESFYLVDPVKSLSCLKQIIDQTESRELSITESEIEKQKNRSDINSKELRILSGYKHSDYYDEAIDLLFRYYTKRPDLFLEFYYAITGKLLYDKHSYYDKYRQESKTLLKLWELCKAGNNYLFTLLYIHVAEYALNAEFNYIEEGRNSREISFCRATIVLTEEMKRIRSDIWNALFALREKEQYKDRINRVITKRWVGGFDEKTTREFIIFDFNKIYPFIKDNVDYYSAKTIDLYRTDFKNTHIEIDDRLRRADENECFRIYRLLTREHIIGRTMEEDERIRRDEIWEEIKNYSTDDFNGLFDVCEYVFANEADNIWGLESGLSMVFELLEGDVQKYKEVFKLFLEHEVSISYYSISRIVSFLLKSVGYKETHDTVCRCEFKAKDDWLFNIWNCLPEESICWEIAEEFLQFIEKHDTAFIPDIMVLSKYCGVNGAFLDSIIRILIDDTDASSRFLGGCLRDEEVMKLLEVFHNREEDLYRIYTNTFGSRIDYEGKLFKSIYFYNQKIWEEYVDNLKCHRYYDYNEYRIIEFIWSTPEYEERVLYAFDALVDGVFFGNEQIASVLFGKGNENKKKEWLLNQLNNSDNDLNKFKRLINVVALAYPEWEAEYIVEYLRINESLDDFKKIYLFPLTKSWSGSEIPLINKEIQFLEELNNMIKGIEFLEHKQYLNEYIEEKEKEKDRVEVREYLENFSWT